MARIPIGSLQAGQRLEDQVFLIQAKDLRTTTNGSLYIHTVLMDSTGQILGRVWNATEEMFNTMPQGGFLRFRGRVESYKGNLQFIIDAMRPADAEQIDIREFLPATKKNVAQMWARVKDILRTIENKHVLALVGEFVNDEPLMERFRTSPAAAQLHHAFIGGLLEHTLNVLELALVVTPLYPNISRDLVLAGAFLHDLGKGEELQSTQGFGYTDRGQLVGHIAMCAVWLDRKARDLEARTGEPFPPDVLTALQHLVLSHHGTYEFGSPKLPATPEAILLHHIDNIDAKIEIYSRAIAADPDENGDWSQYMPSISTKVYKKDVLGIRSA